MEFSAEKVLKNRFSKKFRGIFRGKSLSSEKNVRKIGPRRQFLTPVFEPTGKNYALLELAPRHPPPPFPL
jgi:hypothetical protein